MPFDAAVAAAVGSVILNVASNAIYDAAAVPGWRWLRSGQPSRSNRQVAMELARDIVTVEAGLDKKAVPFLDDLLDRSEVRDLVRTLYYWRLDRPSTTPTAARELFITIWRRHADSRLDAV